MSFWNRPVHTRDLVSLLAAATVTWLLIVSAELYFIWPHVGFRVDLHDQLMDLRLPDNMQGSGTVRSQIPVQLRIDKPIELPIDQVVSVSVKNAMPARVKMSAVVPVHTSVSFKQTIPVETELHMMVPIRSWLPPVPATLPVKLNVPVDIQLPIDLQFPFNIDNLAVATMPEPIQVPLKTTFKSVVKVDQFVKADVLGESQFTLLTPLSAVPVRIEKASLNFSLADFGWEWVD
ncbi:MAG TPA: hypothetical protein VFM46_05650 [Pseudomonadales bacterium]|nr:hypothetical protein [Pseudomonadales bacterium]